MEQAGTAVQSESSISLSYRPTGYCPHCGYPTDTGRCTECGREVTADKLLKDAGEFQHRRRARWSSALLLSICTLILLSNIVEAIPWIRLVPTSMLLAQLGAAASPATIELARRYAAGGLTEEQTAQLLEKVVWCNNAGGKPTNVAGVPIPLGITWGSWVALPETGVAVLSEVFMDDKLVHSTDEPAGWFGGRTDEVSVNSALLAPAQKPGVHSVKWRVTFIVARRDADGDFDGEHPVHTWQQDLTASLTVVDASAESIVRRIRPRQGGASALAKLEIPCRKEIGDVPAGTIVIYSNGTDIPIVGKLLIRPAAPGDFVEIGVVACYAHVVGAHRFSVGADGLPDAKLYDFRIVPDATAAYLREINEVLDAIISA